MPNPEILYRGKPVTVGFAQSLTRRFANQDCIDPLELSSIWNRLLNTREQYLERLDCAETLMRLSRDELEFLVPEPQS